MDYWLRCEASQGQFSDEFAVSAKQFNGKEFSLFVPSEHVAVSRDPAPGQSVGGLLRVAILEAKGDLLLIRIPRQAFESGQVVTVNKSNVVKRAVREKA